jgi:hypothetical protein
LAVGSWQLAVGSWQLAVGSWQLAVGSWQLKKVSIFDQRVKQYFFFFYAGELFTRLSACPLFLLSF